MLVVVSRAVEFPRELGQEFVRFLFGSHLFGDVLPHAIHELGVVRRAKPHRSGGEEAVAFAGRAGFGWVGDESVLVFAVETVLAVIEMAEFVDGTVSRRRPLVEFEVGPNVVTGRVRQERRDALVVACSGAR